MTTEKLPTTQPTPTAPLGIELFKPIPGAESALSGIQVRMKDLETRYADEITKRSQQLIESTEARATAEISGLPLESKLQPQFFNLRWAAGQIFRGARQEEEKLQQELEQLRENLHMELSNLWHLMYQ